MLYLYNVSLILISQACTQVIYNLGRKYIAYMHVRVMYFVFTPECTRKRGNKRHRQHKASHKLRSS